MDRRTFNALVGLGVSGSLGWRLGLGTEQTSQSDRENSTALSLSSTPAKDSHVGGGDQNPGLESDARAIAKWQDAKIGFTTHLGPSALRGTEISWSRGGEVPTQEYDSLYKEFDPVLFNAQEWVQLLKDSGFRYVTLVSKHHDGFVLWDTKQTDHNIMNSPFHRDWLKEMSDECHKQGIMFGVYYSIMDFYQYDFIEGPDSPAHNAGGPGFKLDREPDLERYVSYMKAELTELIQDYGIEILLFDGDTTPTWTHDRGSDLYRNLRGLSRTLIISNRVDTAADQGEPQGTVYFDRALWISYPRKPWNRQKYAGDYLEREQYIGGPAPYPWETWITLGDQWGWKPNDKNKSPEDCIRYLVAAAGAGGNFNLNVSPMLDGRFEQRQKDTMLKIGAWLKANGESIYGTRAGPFERGPWGASTQRANKVYLHVLAWPLQENLRLPPLNRTVKSGRLLNGGEVQWKQAANGVDIFVPDGQRDPLDTIVELTVGG